MDGEDELARVEGCIVEVERGIMGQLACIARLAADRHDTGEAERLLRRMHHILAALHEHRRALLDHRDDAARSGDTASGDGAGA